MANTVILASLLLVFTLLSSPFLSNAISCHGPCQTLNDCDGQLICINGQCNDDPDVGTHICTGGGGGSTSSPGSDDCQPSGQMTSNGQTWPTYTCSPPVTSSTEAKLTLNDFAPGGDGGGASECDGQYHDNSELIVALSTGWYAGGSRCGKMINIRAGNGNSVKAKVVDECDSMHGCDQEHANQGPCRNNIVDGSEAVWNSLGQSLSSCNGPCRTMDDCTGQLICINRKCNDDPDVGTHICRGSTPSPRPGNKCQPSGTLTCKGRHYTTYTCSPPVTSSTAAKLTLNDFEKGGDGGGPSECDDQYHDNSDPIVALSTGWYNGGSRCGKMITITARNGRSVRAKVVDESDSLRGCDAEHAGQPPCKNNIVDGSDAVWNALGLNKDLGVVDVTWSMA